MKKRLNIALVAHDARKQELVEWCTHNAQWLNKHKLFGTGTTARMLNQIMVPVEKKEGFISPDCEALPLSVKPLPDVDLDYFFENPDFDRVFCFL